MLLLLERATPDSEMRKPSQNGSLPDVKYSTGMCKLPPPLYTANELLCSLISCTVLNEL